ncbi:hypothetical protein QQF64_009283 [Cirrhinus molitorella]|uniref:Transmembrane protein 176A-like n=1 Tax=Cirrhinus molitorella TaxID=172907 RepID=A0ABR3M359_9TELE
MESLDDEKLMSDITIPGTHGGPSVECQSWSLEDQLKAGIRYFDLTVSGDKLKVVYGLFSQHTTFFEVFNIIKDFLSKFQTETVLSQGRLVFITCWKSEVCSSMSVTLSKGEGLTVITIASNPKSKWPVLCQILAFLCCSPVCSVSLNMKKKLTNIHTALGTMQIIVGVIIIVFGIFFTITWTWNIIGDSGVAFWIGGVVVVIGIVTILATKFPSPILLVIAVILNVVSAALAITAVVLYSIDLATGSNLYCRTSYYSSYGDYVTSSPEKMRQTEICMQYKYLNNMILGGLDILMIVLSVLHLCVTISFCVLTGKALCKKDEDAKSVEDPELYKPLMEDATVGPAC